MSTRPISNDSKLPMKKSEACPGCGGSLAPHWKTRDDRGHCWEYDRCRDCQWIQLHLDGSTSAWQEASYTPNYYGEGFSKFSGAIQALRELSAHRRASEIHRLFSSTGRVLDIGCGEGLFLKAMQRLGWNADGCEIGEKAAERAEKSLGVKIHHGEFETMPRPDRPWNVVMLWHVLEHVVDPLKLLRSIMGSIDDGGLLIIAVPNAESWQARLFGPDWFHLDPPRHLQSMGLSHLKSLAHRAGWNVVGERHFSLEYNPFGWAQSLLNSMGWRRDAMYETLKRHPKWTRERFALRILAWLLLGPSIIPAIFEAAAKRGGTVVVHLRKP